MITLVRFDYQPAHIIIGAACLWISSSLCLALLTRNIIDINPVLSHLYSRLGQTDLDGQLLPGEDVRVVGAGEGFLQLLQLEGGESCPVPPLFPHLGDAVLVSHSNLRAGVQTWRPTGRARAENVSRVTPRVVVLALLLRLPLELLLAHPAVREAHDVGDEEGLGAGLRPGDVRGGRADCEGSAVHGGGNLWLWRQSSPANKHFYISAWSEGREEVRHLALSEQNKSE